MMKKLFTVGLLGSLSQLALANKIDLCVFDVAGTNGDIMNIIKDYTLAAKQWDVEIRSKVYTSLVKAQQDFDQKRCNGLVADNFSTKKYNNFMGTIGAARIIPNYNVARQVFQALGSPQLTGKFNTVSYEVVGFIPYGFAYLFTKDRSINSLEDLQGKRLGIMEADPSQSRMAQKVGMVPVPMNIDNVANKFRRGEFDLVPVPLIAYQAYDGKEILGEKGGVVNYPLAMVSMNVVLHKGGYPFDFGQKSRRWFAQQSVAMINTVEAWQRHIPPHMFYGISKTDHTSYDRLTSQLRKEFIENRTYDLAMINLVRNIRCRQEPEFIECKE